LCDVALFMPYGCHASALTLDSLDLTQNPRFMEDNKNIKGEEK